MTHPLHSADFHKKLIPGKDLQPIVNSMQSFLRNSLIRDSGYFHVWISASENTPFFRSTLDKAFFMTLIQDNLSPRAQLLELPRGNKVLAGTLDLLAYSLTDKGVHLLVHATRKNAIEELGQVLLLGYATHAQGNPMFTALPFDTIFMFDHLAGRHEALMVSRQIHMRHDNWRYDRYSSIGFYLDDRRGDWMRPHRLTSLFKNKSRQYLRFMKSQATESDRIFEYLET